MKVDLLVVNLRHMRRYQICTPAPALVIICCLAEFNDFLIPGLARKMLSSLVSMFHGELCCWVINFIRGRSAGVVEFAISNVLVLREGPESVLVF